MVALGLFLAVNNLMFSVLNYIKVSLQFEKTIIFCIVISPKQCLVMYLSLMTNVLQYIVKCFVEIVPWFFKKAKNQHGCKQFRENTKLEP